MLTVAGGGGRCLKMLTVAGGGVWALLTSAA